MNLSRVVAGFKTASMSLLQAWASTLLLVSLTFLLVRLVPGSPFDDPKLSPEIRHLLEKQFQLHLPLWQQLQWYMLQWCQGNWGVSMVSPEQPVLGRVLEALQVSLPLGVGAFWVGLLNATAGAVGGIHPTSSSHPKKGQFLIPYLAQGYHVGIAMPLLVCPLFALVGLGVWLLGVQWGWLPVGGWDNPFTTYGKYMVLPVLALSTIIFTPVYWLLRERLITLQTDRLALRLHASGIPYQRIQWRHLLPLAYQNVFPLLGPLFASVLTGSFTVESMLGLPGLGKLTVESLLARDYTLLLGCMSMIGLLFSLSMMGFQWLTALLQPHVAREAS
ncbi:MAG: ABC transporter permease [Vampirovibrionales bacterium]